jgi:Xaa-Pro aminopeptidase
MLKWTSEELEMRARCLDARRQNVRDRLQTEGLDGLIAYGSGNHSFLAMNPGWYLSAFKQIGQHMAVIVPVEGDPALVVTPRYDLERAKERATIGDIVAAEPDEFLDVVAAEIKKRGLASRKFGIAGGVQPYYVKAAWAGMFDREPADREKLVSDVAKIRDEWSLNCVRKATAIAEQGYEKLLGVARIGMWEHEVAGELEAFIRGLGAEDNFQLMSAAHHNRSVHRPLDRILQQGDVLLGEITPAVEGEFLQICRTAVLGEPTELQREKFALLDSGLRAGMKAAKPGTPVKDVVEAINEPINAAGYAKYTVPPYMRTRGHAMTLGSTEPEISTDSGHVLQKDMVFVMHPNQYLPETGYMMCGEPVIITENGAESLTSRMGTLDSIQ